MVFAVMNIYPDVCGQMPLLLARLGPIAASWIRRLVQR